MAEDKASKIGPLAVRNSLSLGVFLAVAAHPRVPFTVVELAGRGIAADAAANRWVLQVGKSSLDGFTLGDKMIDLAGWGDGLVDLWQRFGDGAIDAVAFEAGLAEIVTAIEEWPSVPEGPAEDFSSRLRRVLGPGADR